MLPAASMPGRERSIRAFRGISVKPAPIGGVPAKMGVSAMLRTTAFVLVAVAATPVGAQTIEETLTTAYVRSTQLDQQRAQQRAIDEQIPQALSNWRPTV